MFAPGCGLPFLRVWLTSPRGCRRPRQWWQESVGAHQSVVHSHDVDFSRFPSLCWHNPLQEVSPLLHADVLQLVIDLVVVDQVVAGFPVMHRAGAAQPSLQGRDVVLAQQRRGGFRWIWSAPGPIGRAGRAVEDRSAGGHGMPPGF